MNQNQRIFWLCWLSPLLFLLIDLETTVIGLEVFGMYETNALTRIFLAYGPIGYIITFLVSAGFLFIMIAGTEKVIAKVYKIGYNLPFPEKRTGLVYIIIAVGTIFGSIMAIINNTIHLAAAMS